MVKVYDWTSNQPPQMPKAADMRYGVGYMNDILMDMTKSMSTLLCKVGEYRKVNCDEVVERFETSTLGVQVGILKDRYSGVELVYSKMEELVRKRNYFIHDFKTSGKSSFAEDAKMLSDLINLILKVNGQLSNAKLKVDKSIKKAKNIKKNDVVNAVRSATKNCKEYKKGRIDLKIIAQNLSGKVKWDKKFYRFLEDNSIKTYHDEKDRTIRYIMVSEVK